MDAGDMGGKKVVGTGGPGPGGSKDSGCISGRREREGGGRENIRSSRELKSWTNEVATKL